MKSEAHGGGARRFAPLLYGLLAYAGFLAVFLYLVFFLNDGPVPRSIEGAPSLALGRAISWDLALIAFFGLQHAVMARPAFKRAWIRLIPEAVERSTFVLATVLVLGAAMAFWQPLAGTLFHVEAAPLRIALYTVQGLGWVILVYTTFLIDHFELFGLRQVWCHFRGTELPQLPFRAPSLYRFSRHPMMLGVLLAFWVTPDMTAGRLLWAAGFTVYLLVGIRMEERDLVATLGEDYRRYQQSVPRLLPKPGFFRA